MRLRPTGSDADARLATEPHGGGAAPVPPQGELGRDPEQRRFDLKMIGLVLVLAAVLVGGLFVYLHFHDRAVARARARADVAARAAAAQAEAADKVAEVKQAYLDYDAAFNRMAQQVSLAPLQPYLTSAGLQQEQSELPQAQRNGPHLDEAQHDIQVVVYASGQLASVDDVQLQRSTPVDPTTLQPTGTTRVLPLHESFAMRLQGGRWLVDSALVFGADGSYPTLGLSYAAINRDKPLDADVRGQIQKGYEAYLAARHEAYQNLDPAPLRAAILPGGALDKDLEYLNTHIQAHYGLAGRDEHNFRIALKDPLTAYVYDTIADSSYLFDFATKQPLPTLPTTIDRETYELKKVGGQWKVDDVIRNINTT